MNWIKQNKFLAGFIAFMVVGTGAFGFLLLQAQGRYGAARADYETKVAELNRLEKLKPFPDSENLKQIDAQKAQYIAVATSLQKNVAAAQIPVEPLTREQFQDRLREAVTRITTKAKDGKLALPANFYLGMEKYQTEPPLPEAAPVLGRQLKALEFVVTKMIDDGIAGITRFERDVLPEEEGKGKKEAPQKPGGPPAKADKSAADLVAYHGVQIDLVAEQNRFRKFLNEIVAEKSQFYIPRLLVVRNEKEAAPPRVEAGGAVAVPAPQEPPPPAPGAPVPDNVAVAAPKADSKYTFGSENLNVALVLEIVDFADAASK